MVIFRERWDSNVFLQEPLASMVFRFSLVLLPLDHHHLMFLSPLTIAFNGFSMVLGSLNHHH